MKRIFVAFTYILFFASNFAMAGWVSSGGEFLKDKSNPWFLKNTDHVNICISMDEKAFSLSRERSKYLIGLALQYWKTEFARGDSTLGIASQDFQISDQPCLGGEDLEFRLGYGTLTGEELSYLHDNKMEPQLYVGVAIRKHYEDLRGRGIILLASDSGEGRFQNGRGVPDRFWQNEGLFLRAAVHELGHVFGLPHEVTGMMGERYPEEIIRRFHEGESDLRLLDNLPPFFTLPATVNLNRIEGDLSNLGNLYLIDPVQMSLTGRKIEFSQTRSGVPVVFSTAIVSKSKIFSMEFPIQVFLAKGQIIFPGHENSFLMGPARVKTSLLLKPVLDHDPQDTDPVNIFVQMQPTSVLMTLILKSGESNAIRFAIGE